MGVRKMAVPTPCDCKWDVGGVGRLLSHLAEDEVVWVVMEEKLKGDGDNWAVGIPEVENILCEADDSITDHVAVLIGCGFIAVSRAIGGECCVGSGEFRRTSSSWARPWSWVRSIEGMCRKL